MKPQTSGWFVDPHGHFFGVGARKDHLHARPRQRGFRNDFLAGTARNGEVQEDHFDLAAPGAKQIDGVRPAGCLEDLQTRLAQHFCDSQP